MEGLHYCTQINSSTTPLMLSMIGSIHCWMKLSSWLWGSGSMKMRRNTMRMIASKTWTHLIWRVQSTCMTRHWSSSHRQRSRMARTILRSRTAKNDPILAGTQTIILMRSWQHLTKLRTRRTRRETWGSHACPRPWLRNSQWTLPRVMT
jgi:hypothetical protein